MTLKEYARQENITIGAAYARIWNGRVKAKRVDGRWIVSDEKTPDNNASTANRREALQCAHGASAPQPMTQFAAGEVRFDE